MLRQVRADLTAESVAEKVRHVMTERQDPEQDWKRNAIDDEDTEGNRRVQATPEDDDEDTEGNRRSW